MAFKLKCILLDDERPSLELLKRYCSKIDDLEIVNVFMSPEKMLEKVDELDFDLCLLDINMPGINGLEVAQLLEGKHVIFVTGSKERLVDALGLSPIAVVVKPIKKDQLQSAIEKARIIATSSYQVGTQLFRTRDGNVVVNLDRVVYVGPHPDEKDARNKLMLLDDGSNYCVMNQSLQDFLDVLHPGRHLQVSKGEIIDVLNLHLIVDRDLLELKTTYKGKAIQCNLGVSFRADFKQLTGFENV